MKAAIIIYCEACDKRLNPLKDTIIDTADMPEDLQQKINSHILNHRPYCRYYRTRPDPEQLDFLLKEAIFNEYRKPYD